MVSWPLTPALKTPPVSNEAPEGSPPPVPQGRFSVRRVGMGALAMTGVLAAFGLVTAHGPLYAISGNGAVEQFTPEQLRELGIVTAPTGVVVPALEVDGTEVAQRVDVSLPVPQAERLDGEFDPLMAENPQAARAELDRQALVRRPILVLASAQDSEVAAIPREVDSRTVSVPESPLVLMSAQDPPAETRAALSTEPVARRWVAQYALRPYARVGGAAPGQQKAMASRDGARGEANHAVITSAHFDASAQALVLPYEGRVSSDLTLHRLRDGRVYVDLPGVHLVSGATLGDRPNLGTLTRWAVANQPQGGVRVVLAVNTTCDPRITRGSNMLTIALAPTRDPEVATRGDMTAGAAPRSFSWQPAHPTAICDAELSAAEFDPTRKRLVIPYSGSLREDAIHLHRLPDGRTYLDIRQASARFSGSRSMEVQDEALTRWSMSSSADGRVRLAFEPRLPGRVDVRVLPGRIQIGLPRPAAPLTRSRPAPVEYVQPAAPQVERGAEEPVLTPLDEGVSQ